MKKFLKWFKNSTKIKRWMFLILIGIILVCFGFSKILVSNELGVKGLIEIALAFIVGVLCFVIGIVYIQRRNLEMLIEGNKTELTKFDKDTNINTLATGNSIYEKGPNIVVIGGGEGLDNVLLGLKKYTSNLTAIVAVSAYGKMKTMARKELHLKPLEDIRDSMISLAIDSENMEKLMKYRFTEGKLNGFTFGDIYLSTMEHVYGDFVNSIEKTNNILSMTGRVLPVTLDEMKICAELQDGTIIEEKEKISEVVLDKVTKINRVYINPSNCKTAPGVLDAIKSADAIIIGPGSLYTNVIPSLLIKNVSKTIRDSKGLKIYISNIMTEPGQTDDYDILDHINAITDHSGEGIIDFCLADNGEIVPEYIRKYNLNGSDVVEMNAQGIRAKGITLLKSSLASIQGTHIRHNPNEIAKQIVELICSDLKFKDKHNDEQYVLLNTKLKDEEKKKKTKKGKRVKIKVQTNKHKMKKLSKFSNKYRDRIESIKESETTRQQNIKIQKKAEAILKQEQNEKEKFLKDTYGKSKK